MTRPRTRNQGRAGLDPSQPSPPIGAPCGCYWDPAPGSLGGSGPYRQTATCGQHRFPYQAPEAVRLAVPTSAGAGPGEGEWACLRCGLAFFGTGPEHGLCPECFGGEA